MPGAQGTLESGGPGEQRCSLRAMPGPGWTALDTRPLSPASQTATPSPGKSSGLAAVGELISRLAAQVRVAQPREEGEVEQR